MIRIATALALLCSCATAARVTPSSLPYVRVDTSLPGAVMSREAAIVMTVKRAKALAECSVRIADCKAAREIAEAAARDMLEYAQAVSWWHTYGPGFVVGVGVGGLVFGALLGVLFGGLIHAR